MSENSEILKEKQKILAKRLYTQEFADELKNFIIKTLEDGKAKDVIAISLEGKTDFAKYMIIATGTSSRHINGLAENLLLDMKKEYGLMNLATSGRHQCEWIVIDALDVIVHIFCGESRSHYNLEQLWDK